MKSELRLVRLVRTMSLRCAQSSTPSMATLALWPGAGTRRSVPLLAQTCARYGWVSASDSSPNRSKMSPASACALSSLRRRPARSTASGSWRPFSVWRGRRQRKAPFGGAQPTAASRRWAPDARAELRMTPDDLLEDRDRPQAGSRLQHRHDLGFEDVAQGI